MAIIPKLRSPNGDQLVRRRERHVAPGAKEEMWPWVIMETIWGHLAPICQILFQQTNPGSRESLGLSW